MDAVAGGPIFQIRWVVDDIDAAERRFGNNFAVPRWRRLPDAHFPDDEEIPIR